jgi:hypothetical protein
MADNEKPTADQPEQEQPETPETETSAQESPAAPVTDQVSEDVARDIDTLANQVREEREQADRARMTTVVVFVILIAVIVGYMTWLYSELDDKLSAEGVVLVMIDQGTTAMAQSVGVEREGRDWNEVASVALERKLDDLASQMLRELPQQENEIAQRLRTGIQDGAEYGVELLTDEVMPQLRRTSLARIEGEMGGMIRQAEERIQAAVTQVIEQNKDDLEKLTNKEELQASIADAFEERMGPYLDEAFDRIGAHISDAAVSMAELANKVEEGNLSEEEKLEVLMIQVSHHWFRQIEDRDLDEAMSE